MKTAIEILPAIILIFILALSAIGCDKATEATGLWTNATYLEDTTLGEGANTIKVEITAQEKTIVLTVKTDKSTLGEALYELNIVNDPSFFDTCNGIVADWERDQAYWAFYVGDVLAMYGISDSQAVTADEPTYKLVYTK